jgi:hypothetical protein
MRLDLDDAGRTTLLLFLPWAALSSWAASLTFVERWSDVWMEEHPGRDVPWSGLWPAEIGLFLLWSLSLTLLVPVFVVGVVSVGRSCRALPARIAALVVVLAGSVVGQFALNDTMTGDDFPEYGVGFVRDGRLASLAEVALAGVSALALLAVLGVRRASATR